LGLSEAAKVRGGGGLARAGLTGEQTGTVMLGQKLQPCFGLMPAR
jgi:hypothetical protein